MAWNMDPALLARTYRDPVALLGLIVDLLPVFAVLFLGWAATPLVFLYWLENVVIGGITALRILTAGAMQGVASSVGAVFLVIFFAFHYGMFCFVHGVFVVALSGMAESGMDSVSAGPMSDGFPNPLGLIGYMISFAPGMASILIMILGYNLIVYLTDGVLRGELRDADLKEEMGAPYGRIIVLHFGIFAGFGAMLALGEPMLGVLGLILLRVIWGMFLATRRRLRLDEGGKVDGASRIG
ncbi:MAG: DUF6498-containing protein [Hyphomonadaceae bacterium]|nr:DUF6498-containing protein [Hyphomonadaceae bacterium]